MSAYRVLVTDSLSPQGVEILQNTPGIETVVDHEISAEGLAETLKDFDALVVRSRTKLTADLMAKTDRLKVVGRAGTGLENIDIEAATKRGIAVMNTPGGNTVTTAEHALSMLFSLTRNVPQACASMKAGKGEKKKFQGRKHLQKTLVGMNLEKQAFHTTARRGPGQIRHKLRLTSLGVTAGKSVDSYGMSHIENHRATQ